MTYIDPRVHVVIVKAAKIKIEIHTMINNKYNAPCWPLMLNMNKFIDLHIYSFTNSLSISRECIALYICWCCKCPSLGLYKIKKKKVAEISAKAKIPHAEK